jgi:inorganic pyrophosphatase
MEVARGPRQRNRDGAIPYYRPETGQKQSLARRGSGLGLKKRPMHPWHDVYIDEDQLEETFPVVIEVPMGSKNKYELDKESGLLRLDRVLFSAVHYPANYGFVPRSFCDDGDPLDALVLGQEPVVPLTIMDARAIGVMRMRDDKGIDDKIIAVSVNDPEYHGRRKLDDLPEYKLREIQRFFEDYKALEQKEVVVHGIQEREEALQILRNGLVMYRKLRRGEISKD